MKLRFLEKLNDKKFYKKASELPGVDKDSLKLHLKKDRANNNDTLPNKKKAG